MVRLGALPVEQHFGAHVGSHQDQGIAKIDDLALAVFHPALVEHLEEHFMDVGVSLFNLVEQDHAVRPTAHRLGQDTAFTVTDITWRRALQRSNRVRLLVLAHVDRYQVVLTAIQQFRQGQGGFRLAYARRAGKQEHPYRFARVIEPGTGGLNTTGNRFHRMGLANDTLTQALGEVEDGFNFIALQGAQRNAGPALQHAGHRLRIDIRQYQGRRFRLGGVQALLQRFGALQKGGLQFSLLHAWREVLGAEAFAQLLDLADPSSLRLPALFQLSAVLLFIAQLLRKALQTLRVEQANGLFRLHHHFFSAQVCNALAAVSQLCGHRLLTDANPRTGGVEQADGFIRELAIRQITV